MKKYISLILISTFLTLLNTHLGAVKPTEEEFKKTLSKVRGIYESSLTYSLDRQLRTNMFLTYLNNPSNDDRSIFDTHLVLNHSNSEDNNLCNMEGLIITPGSNFIDLSYRDFSLPNYSSRNDRANVILEKLQFQKTGLPADSLEKHLKNSLDIQQSNINGLNDTLKFLDQATQESHRTFSLTDLFSTFFNSRLASLEIRLNRKTGGNIISTLPHDIDREKDPLNRDIAIRSRDMFQEREHVLVLLYPFIDPVYLTDDIRLGLSLDKGLLAKLLKKKKDMGDPDSAFETFPIPKNLTTVKVVYSKPIDTATKTTTPQKVQKIRVALQERDPLAVYLRNVIRETPTDIYIDSSYAIDWEALKKVPFQNQVNFVNFQGIKLKAPPLFYGNLMDEVKKKQLEEKKQKQKLITSQPKPSQPPVEKKERKKRSEVRQPELEQQQQQQPPVISETPQIPGETSIPSEEFIGSTPSSSNDESTLGQVKQKRSSTPNYQRPEKPSREEKRKAFEEAPPMEPITIKLTSSKMEETKPSKVSSPIKLSKPALDVLDRLYGLGDYKKRHASELDWDDFVSTYKELREKMDGILDAKVINKSGAMRKLSGGPLQGIKMKARSFGIHEPHSTDGHTLGRSQMDRIAKHFQKKFGWTIESLGLSKE